MSRSQVIHFDKPKRIRKPLALGVIAALVCSAFLVIFFSAQTLEEVHTPKLEKQSGIISTLSNPFGKGGSSYVESEKVAMEPEVVELDIQTPDAPLVCFEPSCEFKSQADLRDFLNNLQRKHALGQIPTFDELNSYARFKLMGNITLDSNFVRRLMEEFNALDPVNGRSHVFSRLQDLEGGHLIIQSMLPELLNAGLESKDNEILYRIAGYYAIYLSNERMPSALREFAFSHPDTNTARQLLIYSSNVFSDEELRGFVMGGGKGIRSAYEELAKRGSALGVDPVSASYFDEMNKLSAGLVASLPDERWDGITRRYLSMDNLGIPEREQAFKFILSAEYYNEAFLIWQDLYKRDQLRAESLLPKLLAVDFYKFPERVEVFKLTGNDPGKGSAHFEAR